MTAHKLRTTLTLFYVTEGSSLFFFSSRRLHTRSLRDWSSDVCSSDLERRMEELDVRAGEHGLPVRTGSRDLLPVVEDRDRGHRGPGGRLLRNVVTLGRVPCRPLDR